MGSQIELLEGRLLIDPQELLSRSRATERDVVVLSGTLLEGFGNLYSDLDLYVISDRLPAKGPDVPARLVVREDGRVRRINESLTCPNSILLDVQYYTFAELETLARSLKILYEESRQSTGIFLRTLHHEDEDLIHKLMTGRILQEGSSGVDVRGMFDPGMFCFLKYRNEVGGYAEFRDLVGSWVAGDLSTCAYITRSYLISQVSGMMFLAGSTNPRPKWFVRRLTSLGEEYAELRDGVMSWLYGPQQTESQKREAIETACSLIDMTYAHARRLLGTNARYFSAEEALEMARAELSSRAMHDEDAQAQWQLRRRMFSSSEPPIFAQIRSRSHGSNSAETPRAAMR